MQNKASPDEKAVGTPLYGQFTDYQKVNCQSGVNGVSMPTPRTYEGNEYYGAEDVAKIIGVGRTTVLFWHQKGLFTADKRAHDGRYLYEVERVMQLAAVYFRFYEV